jgi:competence protein ComEA
VARHSEDHTTRQRLAALTGAAYEPPEPEPVRSPFDPGRPGLKVLAAAAAVVVIGAGAWAWLSRPQPVEIAPAPIAASAETATGTGTIVVAVAGKVKNPGLVRLKADARVADAIEAAGGVLPGTDLSTVNLARRVADGELVTVGAPAPAGADSGKLNLNTATAAQLDKLPGVGPVLAERIVAYRESKGGFRSVGDLRQVEGIGDAKYAELKDLVVV